MSEWARLSKYSIQHETGKWRIAKIKIRGRWIYELYEHASGGWTNRSTHESADEAKAQAGKLD